MVLGGFGMFGWLLGGCGKCAMNGLDSSLSVFLGELLVSRVSCLATQTDKTKQ